MPGCSRSRSGPRLRPTRTPRVFRAWSARRSAAGAGAGRLGGRRAQALDPLREERVDDDLLAALRLDLRPRAESLQGLLRHRLRETQPLEHGRPVGRALAARTARIVFCSEVSNRATAPRTRAASSSSAASWARAQSSSVAVPPRSTSSQSRCASSIARCGWPFAEPSSGLAPPRRCACSAGSARQRMRRCPRPRAGPSRIGTAEPYSGGSLFSKSCFISPGSEPAKTYEATSPWYWMWLRRIAVQGAAPCRCPGTRPAR